jgi:transcriptional regulator
MYQPAHFRETRPEALRGLIAAHPLSSLVTVSNGRIVANPIPLLLDPARGEHGTLMGHVARTNPLWREFDPAIDALAIFTGPQLYISPALYATKRETARVVPTWNYATVHAYGPLVVHDDPQWLLAFLNRLTNAQEAGRGEPWKVSDAPPAYVDANLKAIVGLEIPIRSIEGKWKVSQNRVPKDQASVVAGLAAAQTPEATAMSALVAEYTNAGRPKA